MLSLNVKLCFVMREVLLLGYEKLSKDDHVANPIGTTNHATKTNVYVA